MKRKIIKITDELMANLLREANPDLPEDLEVLAVFKDNRYQGIIKVVIRSEQLEDVLEAGEYPEEWLTEII